MRTMSVCLVVAWVVVMGVFLAVHDDPRESEEFLHSANEWLEGTAGVTLPAEAKVYDAGALATLFILPVFLLILVFLGSRKIRMLKRQIADGVQTVADAQSVLVTLGSQVQRTGQSMIASAQSSALENGVAQQEAAVQNLSKQVTAAEGAVQQREQELGDRLRALQQTLVSLEQRATAVIERDHQLSSILDNAELEAGDVNDSLEQLEGDDDPVRKVEELERKLQSQGERVTALEGLPTRIEALRTRTTQLKERAAKLEELDPSPCDAVDDLAGEIDSLEETLKGVEGEDDDDPAGKVESWTSDLDGFEQRIAALEGVTPQVLAIRTRVVALKQRLEKADGDDEHHLVDVVSDIQGEVEQLEKDLDAIEEDDPSGSVEQWEKDLKDYNERITALEALMPRVTTVRQHFTQLRNRAEEIDLDKVVKAAEKAKEQLDEALEAAEGEKPGDAIETLEEEKRKLERRLKEVEGQRQQADSLRQQINGLQQRVAGDQN